MADPLDDLESEDEYAARRAREAAKIPAARPGDPRVVAIRFDDAGNVKPPPQPNPMGRARADAMRRAKR